jgi:hypothetical protein
MSSNPASDGEPSPTEAFVEEQIARSLAPYRGKFPPEVIEGFAEELRALAYTHPVASTLLSRARPLEVQHSGPEASPGTTLDTPQAARKGNVA